MAALLPTGIISIISILIISISLAITIIIIIRILSMLALSFFGCCLRSFGRRSRWPSPAACRPTGNFLLCVCSGFWHRGTALLAFEYDSNVCRCVRLFLLLLLLLVVVYVFVFLDDSSGVVVVASVVAGVVVVGFWYW